MHSNDGYTYKYTHSLSNILETPIAPTIPDQSLISIRFFFDSHTKRKPKEENEKKRITRSYREGPISHGCGRGHLRVNKVRSPGPSGPGQDLYLGCCLPAQPENRRED